MDLTNASAIVTGGAGGFGSATVRRLAQKGAKALTVRATRSATSENAVKTKFNFREPCKGEYIRTPCDYVCWPQTSENPFSATLGGYGPNFRTR